MIIKFKIEEEVEINNKDTLSAIRQSVEYVITQYNYKIFESSENLIAFKPYGTKSISANDIEFYMRKGVFSLYSKSNSQTIMLTYWVSYVADVVMCVLFIFMGIFLTTLGYFFSLINILFFIYKIYKIKRQAIKMLNDVTYVNKPCWFR